MKITIEAPKEDLKITHNQLVQAANMFDTLVIENQKLLKALNGKTTVQINEVPQPDTIEATWRNNAKALRQMADQIKKAIK